VELPLRAAKPDRSEQPLHEEATMKSALAKLTRVCSADRRPISITRRTAQPARRAVGLERLEERVLLSAPDQWLERGLSGGGVLLEPAVSPHNPGELFVGTDMSQMFHSKDFGQSWDIYNFAEFVISNKVTGVQFTSDPQVLFAIDQDNFAFPTPLRSTDSGATWHRPGSAGFASNWKTTEQAWRLFADPNSPGRLVVATQDELYLSTDAGATFTSAYTFTGTVSTSLKLGLHLSGVFFDGADIYAGTNAGLLASMNGANFQTATVGGNPIGGIPATEAIFAFAGASNGSTTRFWAVTHDPATIHTPLDHGGSNSGSSNVYSGFMNLYSIDLGQANWVATTSGLPATTDLRYVLMAANDIDTVYVGGQDNANNFASVYIGKRTVANPTWTNTYIAQGAASNIVTGYVGPGGHIGFSPGIEGLAIDPHDSSRLLMTDGWVAHVSANGGGQWQQVYVPLSQDHAPGALISDTQAYNNTGINNTTVWWIHWPSATNIFAAYDDVKWQRSTNGGATWSYDVTGLDQKRENFSLEVDSATGRMYLSQGRSWAPHDFLGLSDSSVTQGGGDIAYSDDSGATWRILYDFGNPVSWTALDPNDPQTMYASVVDPDPSIGGVYVSHNIDAVNTGGAVMFDRLAAQPNSINAGKPHTIEVLDDGTLVLVLTARKYNHDGNSATAEQHSAGSGVFRLDPGASQWTDVTHPNMHYWCKDLIVDPADPTQSTWYVGVNTAIQPVQQVIGQPSNNGGLYMTTNRGQSWTRVFDKDADSFTVDPANPSEAYLTSQSDGLWFTSNLRLADGVTINSAPTFSQVASFPHQRPNRVFFNPFVPGEVWVASNGAGMVTGNAATPLRTFEFSSANFSVNEGAGSATITVIRTGDAANVMSVDYLVSEGSATANSDFSSSTLATGITGTLTFLPGQSSVTFAVPIVGDSQAEPSETVLLSLTGPIGGNVLGANATATLTILDDDSPALSDIADQTIDEDTTTGALAFTVADAQTSANALNVTGSSSNTLVPSASIMFGGSGADRTVTITPAANQSGSTTITITVTDADGNAASDAFVLTVAAVNDPTTISDVDDQTTSEGTATAAIAFSVGDVETSVGSLVVAGSSSNASLVPNANIVLSGSGADRTVTITPAANQSGSTTITITVTDADGNATSDAFVLTVAAVNDAPTISNVADQATAEDTTTGAIAFTIGDVETAAASLTLTGSSSNTTLVPNSSIVFGGSAANRTVTITPAANQSGTATITVTVSDAVDGSVSDTFVLTVDAVNDLPTISDVVDQTTSEDTATAAIAFTVGDVETSAGSLVVNGSSSNTTLVPNSTIVFGGSGANRTVSITPAANQSGTATITLTVSDADGGSTSDTFVLTVDATNDVPTISITDASVVEGDAANVSVSFVVQLSAASNLAVSVDYSTVDGTADGDSDYAQASGTISFAPGTTTQTINVQVLPDNIDEPDETFTVELSGATNATVADAQGVGTIEDDDPVPSISIGDIPEQEDRGVIVFPFTLSQPSSQTVTIDFRTADGSARAGSDYVAVSGTATIPPLSTTGSVIVQLVADSAPELDETFELQLSNAAGAVPASDVATGTIVNDDQWPPDPAPTVTDVRVRFGSRTTSILGLGRTLPWTNIAAIEVVFSEDVDVDMSDLALTGVRVANYAFSGFSYDASTRTASWTLLSPLAVDRVLMTLDGDGDADDNAGVTDKPAIGTPSFLAGGDFVLSLGVLPGDFDGDGRVTRADAAAIKKQRGGGSLFADLDGDGDVDKVDGKLTRRFMRSVLP
jgi:hypothetical protein